MRSGTRWSAVVAFVLVSLVVGACGGAGPASSFPPPAGDAPLMEAPSAEPLPGATAEAMQDVIAQWVADGNGTGVTAAVVSRAGSWSGAAGVDAAGMELGAPAAMAIASITKTFTAAEVMLLADRGLVDLDQPVSDYVTVPFDTQGATVREVLGMRSGFPMDPIVDVFAAASTDLDRTWTTQDVLALIGPNPGRFGQRGGSSSYNNLNYAVLGALIEDVTGGTYAEAVRRDLIDPAGLPRAWVQIDETPQPPLTVGEESQLYPVVDADGPYLPSRAIASAAGAFGGMAADAPSLARWGYLLYGGYVIDPALVEQMVTTQDDYGLGTAVEVDGEHRVMGHGGDLDSYQGLMAVWPDSQTSVAVLAPNVPALHLGTGIDTFALAKQLHQQIDPTSTDG